MSWTCRLTGLIWGYLHPNLVNHFLYTPHLKKGSKVIGQTKIILYSMVTIENWLQIHLRTFLSTHERFSTPLAPRAGVWTPWAKVYQFDRFGQCFSSLYCTWSELYIFSLFPVLINRGQQELIHLSVACVNITQKKRKNTSKAFWAKGYSVAVK